ncbi:hypothetical protein IE077_004254 [Cardiosporidium cionae]|uniref:ABC transporter domain-containing protein n=1 Tax=Cardiosporidium cionae TaxID=476202 RepID=A0ABQ7JD54_9APIC|nr:hypothetical protein IE077_004254 [Cardiosporidium cionae]|eukprot:KAF8821906.1 hypothetical protein IE077_004254 [Cardiosporidium cionae]
MRRLFPSRRVALSGSILFNGKQLNSSIIHLLKYVMSADKALEHLTVQETLIFSARLRMRNSTAESFLMSKSASTPLERRLRIDEVVQELNLTKCRNTLVGGSHGKGISAGEMKRLSIAMELLENPSVLLLDEPTTGLDAALAFDLVKSLYSLAKFGNRTIICTIHQPRAQRHAGFNVADYLMDLLTPFTREESNRSLNTPKPLTTPSTSPDRKLSEEIHKEEDAFGTELVTSSCMDDSDNIYQEKKKEATVFLFDRVKVDVQFVQDLPNLYRSSVLYQQNKEKSVKAMEITKPFERISLNHKVFDWFSLFTILLHRTLFNNLKLPSIFLFKFLIAAIQGLLIGGVFIGIGRAIPSNPREAQLRAGSLAGSLFFIVSQLSFGNFDTVTSFLTERIIFNRETANRLYSTSSFFVAKFLGDIIPQQLAPIGFVLLVFFMIGFSSSFEYFLIFFLIVQLTVFAAISVLLTVGALAKNIEVAQIFSPVIFVLFMMVSGLFIRDNDMPAYLAWVRYLSFMRYSFFAFSLNHFPIGGNFGGIRNSTLLRDQLGVSESNLWLAISYLFGLGVIYRITSFIALKFFNRKVGLES